MWLGVLMKALITTEPTDSVKQPVVGSYTSSAIGSSLVTIVGLDLLLEEVDEGQIYIILSAVSFPTGFHSTRKAASFADFLDPG